MNEYKMNLMTKRIEHIFENEEEKKRCCVCQTYLPLIDFNLCKSTWDKLRPTCKQCLHRRRMANREQMTLYNQKYWQQTREAQKLRHKKWRENNVEHRRKYNKEWREKRKKSGQIE